jgi:hypothetical protein
MANTTFSGPVRSENGFKSITKDSTTGAVTEIATLGGAPVALEDGDTTLTNAAHSGRILIVPDGGQDNTLTLPSPVTGAYFQFVYGGGAADATDFIIDSGSDTNYFVGGITFFDEDAGSGGDEVAPVFSDGNSNSKLQVNVPAAAHVHVMSPDGATWQIWGYVVSATAPAFADQ